MFHEIWPLHDNDNVSFKDSIEENKELLKNLSTRLDQIRSDIEELVVSVNNFPDSKRSGILGGITNLFKPANKWR